MVDFLDVSDEEPRIYYTVGATPQTVFVVPFVFFTDADLVVYVDGVLKTLTTHYTVAGEGDAAGGSITFLSAQSNVEVGIVRDVPIVQTTHIPTFGPLDVPGINIQFSKFIAMLQQVVSFFTRSIHFPDNDSTSSGELAAPATRANKLLGFDSDGAIIYTTGPTYVGDTATGVASIDSRATLTLTSFDISVNIISTAGYAIPGDGGGGIYKRLGSTPSPVRSWHQRSADGAYWQLSETIVYPEMLGAVGDGATDCTSVLHDWLLFGGGKTIAMFPNAVYMTDPHVINGDNVPKKIIANGAKWKARDGSVNPTVTIQNPQNSYEGTSIEGFWIIDADGKHENGLKIRGAQAVSYNGIRVENAIGVGVVFQGEPGFGIYYNTFANICARGCGGTGIAYKSINNEEDSGFYIASNAYINMTSQDNGAYGHEIDYASGTWISPEAENNAAAGLSFDNTVDATVLGGYTERNADPAAGGPNDRSVNGTVNSLGVKIIGGRHLGQFSGLNLNDGNSILVTGVAFEVRQFQVAGIGMAEAPPVVDGINSNRDIIFQRGNTTILKIVGEGDIGAGETGAVLRMSNSAGVNLVQILLGAADSGGSGYRTLRVPN